MRASKSLVYRTMRNKRKPPHIQYAVTGNGENGDQDRPAKKQFDTGDVDFEITGGSYGVNITPPGSDAFPYVLRNVIEINSDTYKNITGKIKDILERERFLDYFSSVVKVHTNDVGYNAMIYMNNQQGTTGYLIMPNGYIFIALPITTLTHTYYDNGDVDIAFYIPLLIDTLNNMIYDVTDELPVDIAYAIDYYFKTLLGFAYSPKEEYRLTMFACQLLPFPPTNYGIMTAIGHIGRTGSNFGGSTSSAELTEDYNPLKNKFDELSIGYTFYEK